MSEASVHEANTAPRPLYGDAVGSTLAVSLFARARADEYFGTPGWRDPEAEAVLGRLERLGEADAPLPEQLALTDRGTMVGTVARSKALDARVWDFAERHPGAAVVTVGIGLCTRAWRLACLEGVEWVGVDNPDVIALRRRLLPGDPTRLIGGDITRPEWFAELAPDRPTIVVAEGVLMYLDRGLVAQFMVRLADRMRATTWLAADAHHEWLVRATPELTRRTGTRFGFGVRGAEGFAALAPGWAVVRQDDTMAPISPGARRFSRIFRRLTGAMAYGVHTLEAPRPGAA